MDNGKHYAVCLGRQLGSGGGEIAKYLADELGFSFYDKELLYAAAARSGYSTDVFERSDEEKGDLHSFFSHLVPFVGAADFYGNHMDGDFLFRILGDTIRGIASEQDCVFVGRCAEYILREKKDAMVSVFIVADEDDRVKRLCEKMKIKPAAAHKLIVSNDKRRAVFHDFYSTNQWGKALTYDLCINQSRFGMEKTKALVLEFIKKRFDIG